MGVFLRAFGSIELLDETTATMVTDYGVDASLRPEIGWQPRAKTQPPAKVGSAVVINILRFPFCPCVDLSGTSTSGSVLGCPPIALTFLDMSLLNMRASIAGTISHSGFPISSDGVTSNRSACD